MKRIVNVVFLMVVFFMGAQDKKIVLDKIVKKDFTVIEGNVIRVTNNMVDFTYVNEKNINSLDVNSIAKIYFSSGRVQEFIGVSIENSNTQKAAVKSSSLIFRAIQKNTLAVLPVAFLNTETYGTSNERAKYAQNDLYGEISKYSNEYILQDIRETNNFLSMAGIDCNALDTVPIETLQRVLGVDTIVIGKVSYTVNKNQYINSDSYSSIEIDEKYDRSYSSDFFDASIEDETDYDYKVYLDIYKNHQKIYSQTRVPFAVFGAGKDKWIDAMKYLIKRSPLYVRGY